MTANGLADSHLNIGYRAAELVAEYVSRLEDLPVAAHASVSDLVDMFDESLPIDGISDNAVLSEFKDRVLQNSMQISSPNYFGLFNPTPLPIAVWADALASCLNQNGAVWRNSSAANVVEDRVIRWLCALVGYPETAFGTLTSGGSEANLVGLKCARDRAIAGIRDQGIAATGRQLVFYASDQCHYSFVKSVDILGLGRNALRKIKTDEGFHIRLEALRNQIQQDIDEGNVVGGIVGAAGATSTGVIDPLDEMADVAREFNCWFHVDAAYGGALAFSSTHRNRLKGLELADSVTLDPHKWMFVPFACGAVLTLEGKSILRESFDITPEYLSEDRGGADVEYDFFRYGQLGTTRFNALKLWMALKSFGVRGYEKFIDRQIELTQYLASRIDELADFERVGNVETAVCCFRFRPRASHDLSVDNQDSLQQQIQQRVELSGRAWFATTILNGRRVLRININSILTERRHVDDLIDHVVSCGNALLKEGLLDK